MILYATQRGFLSSQCLRPRSFRCSAAPRAALRSEGLGFRRAIEVKDLSKALQILEQNEFKDEAENASSQFALLDACIEEEDMLLVVKTYAHLTKKGLLRSFGKFKSKASEPGERFITPMTMRKIAGLEASQLSPTKWGGAAASAFIFMAMILLQFILRQNGVDIRPLLILVLGLGVADSIFFQNIGLSQIQSLWLPHRRRVMVHEAGHVLVAYLLGCPLRGVVLDALQAVKFGIRGQAGTQFWDAALEEELVLGRLTSTSLDRYCMVLFAGIAAEALVYGEAEGGESDEKMYASIVTGLSPPWSAAKKGNQARWAVLQSFKLLKEHRHVHEAVTEALQQGAPLSGIVKAIEETIIEET